MSETVPLLPFDLDSDDGVSVPGGPFNYLGLALRDYEWPNYLMSLTWGDTLPSFVVIHHTVNPYASWAPYSEGFAWDAGEIGMDATAKKTKRLNQLLGLRDYCQDTLDWDRGPHLFIDDEWIYVFTPLTMPGIHAYDGNADPTGDGYSIGIEVIGYYQSITWPFAVESNVIAAVVGLQSVLGTFDFIDQPWAGGISGHRDYTKPQCPGAAITPAYYLPLFSAAVVPPPAPDDPAMTTPVDPQFLSSWEESGGIWQRNRLTPGYATSPAFIYMGLTYQRFERGVARLGLDGSVSWLTLGEAGTVPIGP